MAHSDELARLRDAVVEAAKAFCSDDDPIAPLFDAVDALLAAEAATCGKCEGYGVQARIVQRAPDWEEKRAIYECPDCGGTGRKRQDRFRDDSATTPEGHER